VSCENAHSWPAWSLGDFKHLHDTVCWKACRAPAPSIGPLLNPGGILRPLRVREICATSSSIKNDTSTQKIIANIQDGEFHYPILYSSQKLEFYLGILTTIQEWETEAQKFGKCAVSRFLCWTSCHRPFSAARMGGEAVPVGYGSTKPGCALSEMEGRFRR
jgi:hypothetical protein